MNIDNKINIPDFLEKMLKEQYTNEDIEKILKGFNKKRFVSIRVNTLKANIEKIKNELINEKIELEEIAWSKNALVIKNADEKKIQELNIYKNGEIYMQSLSSMIPPIILNPKENTDILDMCAAPRRKNNSNGSNYKQ